MTLWVCAPTPASGLSSYSSKEGAGTGLSCLWLGAPGLAGSWFPICK